MGRKQERTIIVQVGKIRPFSDIGGRHTILLDNSRKKRGELAKRLETAGCPAAIYKGKWLEAGNFDLEQPSKKEPVNLLEPLEKNYATVKHHFFQIRKRGNYKDNDHIPYSTKRYILHGLAAYCKYLNMTPDEIIANAQRELTSQRGVDKHNKYLDSFWENRPKNTTYWNFFNYIKAFYKHNGILLTTSRPPRPKMRNIRSLKTEEIERICRKAPLFHSSWIIANSYLGFSVDKITKLQVKDFCIDEWKDNKKLYPVNIREEVSGTFSYTTFIGVDAKEFLSAYFASKRFKQDDHPWNCRKEALNDAFKRYAYQAKIIDAPHGLSNTGAPIGLFDVTPYSFHYRLFSILEDYHVPSNWIAVLTGTQRRSKDSRPTTEQLHEVFLNASPKLKVFSKMPATLQDFIKK